MAKEEQQVQKQHPIPQQVLGVEFKIIGDLTIKQFVYLGVFGLLAVVFFYTPIFIVFRLLICASFAITGVLFALVPIQDQPLDQWLRAFIKAIYHPTKFVWHKQPEPLEFLIAPIPHLAEVAEEVVSPEEAREKLQVYLAAVREREVASPIDLAEKQRLEFINLELQEGVVAEAELPPPPPPPPMAPLPARRFEEAEKKPSLASTINYAEPVLKLQRGKQVAYVSALRNVKVGRRLSYAPTADVTFAPAREKVIAPSIEEPPPPPVMKMGSSFAKATEDEPSKQKSPTPSPTPQSPPKVRDMGPTTPTATAKPKSAPSKPPAPPPPPPAPPTEEKEEKEKQATPPPKVEPEVKEGPEEHPPTPPKPAEEKPETRPKPPAPPAKKEEEQPALPPKPAPKLAGPTTGAPIPSVSEEEGLRADKRAVLIPSPSEEEGSAKQALIPTPPSAGEAPPPTPLTKPEEKPDQAATPSAPEPSTPSAASTKPKLPPPAPAPKGVLKPPPPPVTEPNSIVGTVYDEKGKTLEGELVAIKNLEGVVMRVTKTNQLGQFSFSPLPNGSYTIELPRAKLPFAIMRVELTGSNVPPLEVKART